MSPNEEQTSRTSTPVKPRHGLTPSIRRTTSQLSTISIGSNDHEFSPRKLLSRPPIPSQPSLSSVKSTVPSNIMEIIRADENGNGNENEVNGRDVSNATASSSSRSPSIFTAQFSRSSTPSVTSRKGKERALDMEPEVEVDDIEVIGEMSKPGGLESLEASQTLRRLVNAPVRARSPIPVERLGEDLSGSLSRDVKDTSSRSRSTRRYFVLTHAGKPVFESPPRSEEDDHQSESTTNLMGVVQALISIFAEDDDRPRSIIKGRNQIVFVLKAPLYLFCVSDWGEPEHALRIQLEYIYIQILSVVTSAQLAKIFQRRSNFDLSRLLDGTETFLHSLIARSQYDFSYFTSTLQPLRISPTLREAAASCLNPPQKLRDLLYVLLIADGKIVTLLRPKQHSIHPSDLHLLLNTLATSTALRTAETWIPICLPKFNPAGFVHAYVSYIAEEIGLVFVSADREAFEELRKWKETVLQALEKDKLLGKIQHLMSISPYTVSSLNCSGLRHFIYKSRQHVQITMPEWPEPYDSEQGQDRRRLITLYQRLQDTIHARSGQQGPMKLLYLKSDQEAVLAWVTKPFELYMAVSPNLPKSAVVSTANAVTAWVASESSSIFIKDAPVF